MPPQSCPTSAAEPPSRRVDESQDVGGEHVEGIGRHRLGLVRRRCSRAGRGPGRGSPASASGADLMPPAEPGLGETVEQDDRQAAVGPCRRDMEVHAVRQEAGKVGFARASCNSRVLPRADSLRAQLGHQRGSIEVLQQVGGIVVDGHRAFQVVIAPAAASAGRSSRIPPGTRPRRRRAYRRASRPARQAGRSSRGPRPRYRGPAWSAPHRRRRSCPR